VGGILGVTVIIAEEVTGLPELPVAVSVYVVVLPGLTVVEPEVPTAPTSGVMVTLLALEVVQVKVAVWPRSIVGIFVVKELITG
jgi:hypothetical protein